MNGNGIVCSAAAVILSIVGAAAPAAAATTVQLGDSGKSFASSVVQCTTDPATGQIGPMVQAGLVNPKRNASANVSLNDSFVATVTTANPVTEVRLDEGTNTVRVEFGRKTADSFVFSVATGHCALPDTSGNTFSADGTLEYAASGKSYATVTPGCALNAATGQTQPYVHLWGTGNYLLNVSVNGVALTQLSPLQQHTPVFLAAGMNVIAAANGSLSTDYYVRDGGDGHCALAQ